ncbi:hypothetical protein GQ53DRAFT_215278 [Thozetella sp. PMI_491]|nr:hypothetical protein GQ53DRAFT_215278 [Thozetella sp. PMI_491]
MSRPRLSILARTKLVEPCSPWSASRIARPRDGLFGGLTDVVVDAAGMAMLRPPVSSSPPRMFVRIVPLYPVGAMRIRQTTKRSQTDSREQAARARSTAQPACRAPLYRLKDRRFALRGSGDHHRLPVHFPGGRVQVRPGHDRPDRAGLRSSPLEIETY